MESILRVILSDLSKVLFASLIMSIFLIYFKELNLFILLIAGTVVYLIILYLVKGVDEDDILLIKEIFKH